MGGWIGKGVGIEYSEGGGRWRRRGSLPVVFLFVPLKPPAVACLPQLTAAEGGGGRNCRGGQGKGDLLRRRSGDLRWSAREGCVIDRSAQPPIG